jgi:hypothetical protein
MSSSALLFQFIEEAGQRLTYMRTVVESYTNPKLDAYVVWGFLARHAGSTDKSTTNLAVFHPPSNLPLDTRWWRTFPFPKWSLIR